VSARLNFSRGVIQLEETKNGTRREIPMNQAVYDVLSALPKSGSRLFRGSVRSAFRAPVSAPASRISTSMTCDIPSRPGSRWKAARWKRFRSCSATRASRRPSGIATWLRSGSARCGRHSWIQHNVSTKPGRCGASVRHRYRQL